MVASTRRSSRPAISTARPLGPVSSSGVKKPTQRSSLRKSGSQSIIDPKIHRPKVNRRRTSIESLTALMTNTSITAPTTALRLSEIRERHPSVEESTSPMAGITVSPPSTKAPQSTIPTQPTMPLPPTVLPPPTILPSLSATTADAVPKQRVALNCRYRLPNSYLTVYHRRGHRMLCMPWEMPWLEGEERAV